MLRASSGNNGFHAVLHKSLKTAYPDSRFHVTPAPNDSRRVGVNGLGNLIEDHNTVIVEYDPDKVREEDLLPIYQQAHDDYEDGITYRKVRFKPVMSKDKVKIFQKNVQSHIYNMFKSEITSDVLTVEEKNVIEHIVRSGVLNDIVSNQIKHLYQ